MVDWDTCLFGILATPPLTLLETFMLQNIFVWTEHLNEAY